VKIRLIGVICVRFHRSTGSLRFPGALEFLARQLFINIGRLMSGASSKNEPQINADERRFVALGLGRGAGLLAAGMRQ
jgi:hypothetical protein